VKVLLVGSYYRPGPGGAETVLRETEAILQRAGHETIPFARLEDTTFATPWRSYFPPRLPDRPPLWSRAARESMYSRSARTALAALLRRVRPDVAHLHNIFEQLTLSVVDELHDTGVPVVLTAHDYRPVCPNYRMLASDGVCDRCVGSGRYWQAVRLRCHHSSVSASLLVAAESYLARARRSYDRVDRFVAPSRFLRNVLVAGGLPVDRIDVVPNAIEVGTPPARRVDDPARFVYFGRFSPEKGLDDLLTASRSLRGGTRLQLFGSGPLDEHLRRRVATDGLPVDVNGYAPLEGILPVLAGAVAAVLPARWHENCPMAILEAGAAGVATIGTSLGGIPDLIDDGLDGILVPPGEHAALARAMNDLAADPDRAVELGRRARRRVEERHSPDAHLVRLMASYQRAIDRVALVGAPSAPPVGATLSNRFRRGPSWVERRMAVDEERS
jgi:glycosyltransferase involved in cell wall biosynthesis